jgi:hypothetical protein
MLAYLLTWETDKKSKIPSGLHRCVPEVENVPVTRSCHSNRCAHCALSVDEEERCHFDIELYVIVVQRLWEEMVEIYTNLIGL